MDNIEVPNLKTGTYQHYKGGRYQVIGVAIDSETLQPVVVYKPLYASKAKLWVRPYDMFVGSVEVKGAVLPRFKGLKQ